MSDQFVYTLDNPPEKLANIDFRALDLSGKTELPPFRIASRDEMLGVLNRAFDQSLLDGPSHTWFTYGSVCKSLSQQVCLLGDQSRDFGNISFLTHLMEVTDWVFNCPELRKFPPEMRAFIPTNHDLEDITKTHGLQPFFLRNYFLNFLPVGSPFKPYAAKGLYLLMDPPTISGQTRQDLQIARIPSMDELAVYTRFADKYKTYQRDLHNMQTINPATGKPFLHFTDAKDAEKYLDKMLGKQEVVMALPVAHKYKDAWTELRLEIKNTINDQLGIAPRPEASAGEPATPWKSPHTPWHRGLVSAAHRLFTHILL